jgi:hypothetical protein
MSRMNVLLVAIAVALLGATTPASAQVVPVDPGPIGAGRPIVGTTQNLPSLDASEPFDAGPGFEGPLRAIYASGTIEELQREVVQEANRTIQSWVRRNCPPTATAAGQVRQCRPLVVFDVDDTMLDNFGLYASNVPAFSYNPQRDAEYVLNCSSPVNAPVRWLYRKLSEVGVRIAVITGRPASQREATIACLRERGYPRWDALITRTQATQSATSARFKAQARGSLQRRGYTIVASVGDQISDMAHGRLRYGFLLPNPMYYLP